MLFTKLKLNYFGRFHGVEIDLKPGINLIYGENEAGKSTIHTFIKGMFFGIERMRGRGSASKDDLYTRYLPWDYPGAFNGQMDILVGDNEYRLQRNFHTNDKNFTVINLATGREVKLKEGYISDIIPGLSESAFKNTISIEQLKAQTDAELAAQVRNYIANLSVAKSKEVNVAKAVSSLTEQKKALEATLNTSLLKALQAEIEEGLEREERIDSLTLQLRDLLTEEQELKLLKEAATGSVDSEETMQMEQLPAILEKYRSYQELTRQCAQLERQKGELQVKTTTWVSEQPNGEQIKEELKEAEKVKEELPEYEKRLIDLQKEKANTLKTESRRNSMVCLFPTLVGLLTLWLTWLQPVGIIIALIMSILGITIFAVLHHNTKRKQKQFSDTINGIKQQIPEAKDRLTDILRRNQVNSVEELATKKEEMLKNSFALEISREQLKELEHRIREAEDSRDVLYDTIMKYLQYFIPEEVLTDLSIQSLQEKILSRRQQVSKQQSEANQQYNSCKLRMEKLKWDITALEGNEGQLLNNKDKYAQLEQKQKDNAVELEAIKLALNTIQELSVDIHDSFGRQLNSAVSDIIGEVTDQKYTDIKVDEKLEVKVGWNGDYVLLDKLSAGTMDQVYFALRLAVADLLLGKDEVPLLLDDSFALYDENRVKAALKQISVRKQILLFSCHKREQGLLNELNLPYHFVDLSCR